MACAMRSKLTTGTAAKWPTDARRVDLSSTEYSGYHDSADRQAYRDREARRAAQAPRSVARAAAAALCSSWSRINKAKVTAALRAAGAEVLNAQVAPHGVQWK